MSILNDDRRYSDDSEEYLAWEREVKREYAREQYEKEHEDYEYDNDTVE